MKVLWFANTPCGACERLNNNINGGGWLLSLEKELIKRDDIKLAVCFYYTKEIESFNYNGIHYYPIYRKYSSSKLLRYFGRLLLKQNIERREIENLLTIIESIKPDIIHIHGNEDNFGLIQYHTKLPVVISIQGLINPICEKYYSGIPKNEASKYEGIFNKILLKKNTYFHNNYLKNASRERKILRKTKFIIGRTSWDNRVIKVLSPSSRYFKNNEIIRSEFYKNNWRKLKFEKNLRIISTLSDAFYKGFESIIKTASILKEYPELSFEWIVVGLTRNTSVIKIVEKWLKIDLENLNIKILDPKNEKELVKILLFSDIYCQVSHIENSSNSLCEAMLLGMPIIATFAGGTSSLLEDGKQGILVQDGDPYSIAGSIIELYNDFNNAKQYGRKARKKALLRHNKKAIIKELINIYYSILKD